MLSEYFVKLGLQALNHFFLFLLLPLQDRNSREFCIFLFRICVIQHLTLIS